MYTGKRKIQDKETIISLIDGIWFELVKAAVAALTRNVELIYQIWLNYRLCSE